MVKIRSEAENAAGNAKLPNVFFRDGYKEIWISVITISQLMTAKSCCSTASCILSAEFCVHGIVDTWNDAVPKVIDRDNATNKSDQVFD